MKVLSHGGLALGRADLIAAGEGLLCLRFETMKVASAMGAVEALIQRGELRPGDTVLDSSSGIYAHALALAAHRFGLKCHIVASTTVDRTLQAQLRLLGAHVDQMPATDCLKHDQHRRVARVQSLLNKAKNNPELGTWHWMRQYHDPIHRRGYGAIAEELSSCLDARDITLVGGVGTGVSSAGLALALTQCGHRVRLIGVQPFGSVTFGAEHVDDPDILIAGIGSSIPFGNVRHDLFDAIHWISFETARAATRDLLREHAIFAGLSSGAAWLAAQWEREHTVKQPTVFLAPDTGHRYVDAVFVDECFHRSDHDAPIHCTSPQEVVLPWSRMLWRESSAARQNLAS